jgi:YgiT-type zinc finger domain-containing protein
MVRRKNKKEREAMNVHEYGDCSFCQGEVKEERVELDYRYKGRLYIFREVPAGVCQQCGEKYLTAGIAEEIEKRIQQGKWGKTVAIPVEVFTEEVSP